MSPLIVAIFLAAPPQTVVLTYHDMVPVRDRASLWFDCTPAELEAQLDWLQERGAVFVSTETLYNHLCRGQSIPDRAVVITFADNYRGFTEHAWPILKRRGIPVTMFIHTGFVGSSQGRPKNDWETLGKLAQDPLFTPASQTVSHPTDLRRLSESDLDREFVRSREALATKAPHFGNCLLAYPNGKYDTRVARRARLAGYRMAFTEAQKVAQQAPDRWRIPRYVHTRYFEAWQDAHPSR